MNQPTAICLIREQPHYRRELFHHALKHLGYRVETHQTRRAAQTDLLIIWNRYGPFDEQARLFERAGAPVIVVENGYLPHRGATKAFAMALNHHNGAGTWPGCETPRAPLLDVELRPWFEGAGDVLVLPQRGIGPPGVAMPRSWQGDVLHRLATMRTGRLVRVRPHPGTDRNVLPLDHDLAGAGCVVTWGSGAALKALVAGVPVFHELNKWIGAPAAQFGIDHLDRPVRGDREAVLERVACAQWSAEEVFTGDPIRRLVELHEVREGRGPAPVVDKETP